MIFMILCLALCAQLALAAPVHYSASEPVSKIALAAFVKSIFFFCKNTALNFKTFTASILQPALATIVSICKSPLVCFKIASNCYNIATTCYKTASNIATNCYKTASKCYKTSSNCYKTAFNCYKTATTVFNNTLASATTGIKSAATAFESAPVSVLRRAAITPAISQTTIIIIIVGIAVAIASILFCLFLLVRRARNTHNDALSLPLYLDKLRRVPISVPAPAYFDDDDPYKNDPFAAVVRRPAPSLSAPTSVASRIPAVEHVSQLTLLNDPSIAWGARRNMPPIGIVPLTVPRAVKTRHTPSTPSPDVMAAVAASFRSDNIGYLAPCPPVLGTRKNPRHLPRRPLAKASASAKAARPGKENVWAPHRPSPLRQVTRVSREDAPPTPIRV